MLRCDPIILNDFLHYFSHYFSKDNLPEGCKLSIEDEYEMVIAALNRHGIHLSTHAIDQTHLDPFKLLCWLGCEIVGRLEKGEGFDHQAETILDSVIQSLEIVLALETENGLRLDVPDKMLFKRFLMEEIWGNGNHGIGFNGLFVAFHCMRAAYRKLTGK